jgi:hypothetical protein
VLHEVNFGHFLTDVDLPQDVLQTIEKPLSAFLNNSIPAISLVRRIRVRSAALLLAATPNGT